MAGKEGVRLAVHSAHKNEKVISFTAYTVKIGRSARYHTEEFFFEVPVQTKKPIHFVFITDLVSKTPQSYSLVHTLLTVKIRI